MRFILQSEKILVGLLWDVGVIAGLRPYVGQDSVAYASGIVDPLKLSSFGVQESHDELSSEHQFVAALPRR